MTRDLILNRADWVAQWRKMIEKPLAGDKQPGHHRTQEGMNKRMERPLTAVEKQEMRAEIERRK